MAKNLPIVVFPVKDVDKAKKFFNEFLDAEPYADSPYYVGYKVGDQELGLDPNSTVGPIVYIETEDIKKAVAEMTAAGGEVVKEPTDVAQGLLVAQVKDADGNVVGFRQQP